MWVQKKNVSASSTPFCGYYVVAHSGDYCPLHWANGIQYLNAFPDGANGVYGKVYTEVAANCRWFPKPA
jgi:hypothetical protein